MILFVFGTIAGRTFAPVTDSAISAGDTICALSPAICAFAVAVAYVTGFQDRGRIIRIWGRIIHIEVSQLFLQIVGRDSGYPIIDRTTSTV